LSGSVRVAAFDRSEHAGDFVHQIRRGGNPCLQAWEGAAPPHARIWNGLPIE
jgi:hypothetical protein